MQLLASQRHLHIVSVEFCQGPRYADQFNVIESVQVTRYETKHCIHEWRTCVLGGCQCPNQICNVL